MKLKKAAPSGFFVLRVPYQLVGNYVVVGLLTFYKKGKVS